MADIRTNSKSPMVPGGLAVNTRLEPPKTAASTSQTTNGIVAMPNPETQKPTEPCASKADANERRTQGGLVAGAKGINLTYVPSVIEEGQIAVHLLKEDIEAENQKWNKVSACILQGIDLPLEQLRDTLQGSGVLSQNLRYFSTMMDIKLNSTEEGDEVLFSGGFE